MLKSHAHPRQAECAGGHATERHLFLGGARPKGSALVAQELENGLLHSSRSWQPSSRREGKDVKNVKLVAAASDPDAEPSEAQVARLIGGRRLFCARLFRYDQRHRVPDLLPLQTAVGFLPSFEHVKEKVWREISIGCNQRAGRQRVIAPVELLPRCWRDLRVLFTARVPCGRDGPGRDHCQSAWAKN